MNRILGIGCVGRTSSRKMAVWALDESTALQSALPGHNVKSEVVCLRVEIIRLLHRVRCEYWPSFVRNPLP